MARIRIGTLRHVLELQSETRTPDGGGGVTKEWQTYATVFGSLETLSGKEAQEAGRLEASRTVKCVIRYRDGVTAAHRVKKGDRAFQIRSVRDVTERERFLELDLEEGVAI